VIFSTLFQTTLTPLVLFNSDEKIWNIAKWRFLQSEAALWIIGNKILEIVFLLGLVMWIYFEFFSSGNYQYFKYIGLVLVFFTFLAMRGRYSSYLGFFDGYEQGFKDAAVRNLDYWGSTHNESTDEMAIDAVLQQIENNEENISSKNKEERDKEVKDGFRKLLGFLLTWRKLR
jgi:hypothetical protein